MREIPLRRRGTTVLELIAAGAVLGVLLVVCAQMLSRTVVQQQAIANRRAALRMAGNAMERAHLLSWADLDTDAGRAIAEAVLRQGMLRKSGVDVMIEESKSKLTAKRIKIVVSWSEGADGVKRTEQLIAWRYDTRLRSVTNPDSAGSPESSEVTP